MIRMYVESPEGDLEGLVDECQDLDGRFVLIDDDGEKWIVSGWSCSCEIITA